MNGLACVRCRVFLVPKRNGVAVEEGRPLSSEPDPAWGSYKLWIADLAACPRCGIEVVVGFGGPLAEHYQPEYAEELLRRRPIVRIDACAGYKPRRAFETRSQWVRRDPTPDGFLPHDVSRLYRPLEVEGLGIRYWSRRAQRWFTLDLPSLPEDV